ncbi:MAG: hypothetical protein UT34_C0001G0408 [candidate division WS6 bacterium GW2011_GWF2_39_15]|uniref:Rod shape-determining protein MreD n=1 Tax=candidate division WS6 bacterium GW2011_GWF2_39_15 TaxID=1619100 RepID=A0A0G0MT70_9BACT|nr:MAG: hypothetical protein UT34_C0001G0408 [candidate division WS6 bacterium GW2011_GWF2_39_15]
MTTVIIYIISLVFAPVINAFFLGLFQVNIFPVIALQMVKSNRVGYIYQLVFMVSVINDVVLHLPLGGTFVSLSFMFLLDWSFKRFLPAESFIVRSLTSIVLYFSFNLAITLFKGLSLGDRVKDLIGVNDIVNAFAGALLLALFSIILDQVRVYIGGSKTSNFIRF